MANGKETLTNRVTRLEERDKSQWSKLDKISSDTEHILKRINDLPCKQDALRLDR